MARVSKDEPSPRPRRKGSKAAAPPLPDRGDTLSPEHEDLCSRCGKCCYKKIIVGSTVFITPFPCEFLDTEKNLCTIYEDRFEKNPECLSIREGMKYSAFPSDCGYVEELAPPKYKPAIDTWDWKGQWFDFDELADDLEVSEETREKIRARGPYAPPMWVEANERILQERVANGAAPAEALLTGKPKTVDLNHVEKPPLIPKLSTLLKIKMKRKDLRTPPGKAADE